MGPWGSSDPERGSLLKPSQKKAGAVKGTAGDVLRWDCDSEGANGAVGRSYDAKLPLDTLIILAISTFCVWFADGLSQGSDPVDELNLELRRGRSAAAQQAGQAGVLYYVARLGCLIIVLALLLSPLRVRREADCFVIEYMAHSSRVPLREVLELVMVSDLDDFTDLLVRWGIAPFGCSRLSFFCGTPSGSGAACAVLTSRVFWSFYFCLEDPIKFLVEQQKPLNTSHGYRTMHSAIVREGESLQTKRICLVPRGSRLRIEYQSGRRVYVHFQDQKVSGWMSYINQLGHFLLEKDMTVDCAKSCTVGASEFAGNYGTATIELTSVAKDEVGE